MEQVLEQLREGIPITMTFTGTMEEPGTVVLFSGGDTDEVALPWRVEGGSIIIEQVEDGEYVVLSLTPSGTTMTGSIGSIDVDGTEMRGVVSLTKTG